MRLSSSALLAVVLGCFCQPVFAYEQPPEKYAQFFREFKPGFEKSKPEFGDRLFAAIKQSTSEQEVVSEMQLYTGMDDEEVTAFIDYFLKQYSLLKMKLKDRNQEALTDLSKGISQTILNKSYSSKFASEIFKSWRKFEQCPKQDLIDAIASKDYAYQLFITSEEIKWCPEVAETMLHTFGGTPDLWYRIMDTAPLDRAQTLLLKRQLFADREWFGDEKTSLYLAALYLDELYEQAYLTEFTRVLNGLEPWQRLTLIKGALIRCPMKYCGPNPYGWNNYHQFDVAIMVKQLLETEQAPKAKTITRTYDPHQMEYLHKEEKQEEIEQFDFGDVKFEQIIQGQSSLIIGSKDKTHRENVIYDLLSRYLSTNSDDFYDYFFGGSDKRGAMHGMFVFGPVVALLGAKLAKREGYPVIADDLLGGAEKALFEINDYRSDISKPWKAILDPYLADASFENGIKAERAAWFAKIKADLSSGSTEDGSWLVKLKTKLGWGTLDSEQINPFLSLRKVAFVEKPLPDASGNMEQPNSKVFSHLELPISPWSVVRVAESAGGLYVLYSNHDVDPVGELPGGGYWLIFSTDKGQTWSSPLYLGLQEHQPYEIVRDSGLPIRDGEFFNLEVRRAPLDPDSISFPPVGLRVQSDPSKLYLQFRWQDLVQDSDGDGLNDLLEEKLGLNPMVADSDGDGLSDRLDPLPGVKYEPETDDVTAVMQMAFEQIVNYEKDALPVNPGSTFPISLPTDAVEQGRFYTLFVTGDRKNYASLQLPMRVIVMSTAEVKAAGDKWGIFYPLEIKFYINKAKTKAYIDWSARWQGGSIRFEKSGSEWKSQKESSWIT
ncbi:hypothetical protein JYB88_00370 [Shewanella cyperi]|uniref:Uncharacterized protein n=1 Tax=Shewanella cyperi TaxID=2814292 RepID=A0A974XTP2_9GAMM|nr:hypothetical protein [Shewanella cyperi]QSX30174.1 hypothetical protein JYB88_00370 [Shewanella cyperi]